MDFFKFFMFIRIKKTKNMFASYFVEKIPKTKTSVEFLNEFLVDILALFPEKYLKKLSRVEEKSSLKAHFDNEIKN